MSHPTVSVPQFKDMIRHVVIRNNIPLMGWGDFGIGKSQGGAQAAEEEKAFYADVRLGQYDSVDIRGIPSDDGKGRTHWLRASTFPFVGNDEFPDDQIILLALDEINAANDAVSLFTYEGKPRVMLSLVPTPELRARLERVGFTDRHGPSTKRSFLYAPPA